MQSNSAPAATRVRGVRARLRRTALFVAIALLVLSLLRARERQMAEQRRLSERASDNAATAIRSLDALIGQTETLLLSLSYSVDPARPPATNDAVLKALYREMPTPYANLYLVDTVGRNVGAAMLPSIGRDSVDLSVREYFQTARRSGRFTVGLSVRSLTLDDAPWVLPFIVPIRDTTTQRVRGFLGTSIRLDSLEVMRIAERLPTGSVITVLDSAGRVVMRSLDGSNWNGRRYPNYQGIVTPLTNDTIIASDIDQKDRYFASGFTTRARWTVYVGVPTESVFGPSRRQFALDLFIGLLLSGALMWIGLSAAKRIAGPIESLTADARAISEGDMTRRSVIVTDDEVGALATTFNQMADAIVERERQLEASQEQLRQSQKLEALGAFAGGIAHDFNNYLSSIVGHAELALDQLPHEAPAREELASVLTSAQRATDLTRQILAFSRRQIVSPTSVDVNASLRSMQRLLVRLLGEPVIYRSEFDGTIGSVTMDLGQFEQVMMNLAVNARDAMPNGGYFTVRTSRERTADGHSQVVVTVQDTGSGIPAAVRERIFEPFFTTKDRTHGTGLGLSITYGIVTSAGGTIEVDEAPGGGARFTLRFPEGPPINRTVPNTSQALPRGNAERILLVDDDPSVALVAERLLRRAGYVVQSAPDAAHALGQLATAPFDLLMTDVVMPGMSGPELAQEAVKRHGPMRLLFVSGYPDDDQLAREITAQNAGYLAKPFSQDTLLRKVRELLDGALSQT